MRQWWHDKGAPVITLLACSVLIGASIGFMARAHADSGDLVTWAGNNGFQGSPQSVILRGALVCADLAEGDNGEQAAQDLWVHTGIQNIEDARLFVIAAVDNLCAQYLPPDAPAPAIGGTFKA
jgi:hypothetical protein